MNILSLGGYLVRVLGLGQSTSACCTLCSRHACHKTAGLLAPYGVPYMLVMPYMVVILLQLVQRSLPSRQLLTWVRAVD